MWEWGGLADEGGKSVGGGIDGNVVGGGGGNECDADSWGIPLIDLGGKGGCEDEEGGDGEDSRVFHFESGCDVGYLWYGPKMR